MNSLEEHQLFTNPAATELIRREMVKKFRKQKGNKVGREQPIDLSVLCSSCGVLMRSIGRVEAEHMCLICHARILNDYFHSVRRKNDEKPDTPLAAAE